MRIASINGGIAALYNAHHYAVKTRSDGYVFSVDVVERVTEEIKQIKRKVT